jgi:hypothetical protein
VKIQGFAEPPRLDSEHEHEPNSTLTPELLIYYTLESSRPNPPGVCWSEWEMLHSRYPSYQEKISKPMGVVELTTSRLPGAQVATPLSGCLRWVTDTFPVQCIPDNTITYTLPSPTYLWNINNRTGFKKIRLPLSIILWTTILLNWVATLVTHLLIGLRTAHLGRCRFQGLLIADFSEARFRKRLWLPAKQLNGYTVSTFRTRRTYFQHMYLVDA